MTSPSHPDAGRPREIPKCSSWRGHKFEGRYHTAERDSAFARGDIEMTVRGHESRAMFRDLAKLRDATYVHDICVRCGATVEFRPSSEASRRG